MHCETVKKKLSMLISGRKV